MKKMTIKQKMIGMIIILSLMIAGLSVFFVNRFAAMGQSYQKIPVERVPQLVVSETMGKVFLNARININELAGVERDLKNFDLFSQRVGEKLKTYKILEQAMLKGHPDLGREIQGLEGLAVLPCRRGGEMETLTMDLSKRFEAYEDLCRQIMEKKKKQLDLVNSTGWYDTDENSAGMVKTIVETGRKMEALAQDVETKLKVAQIRQQEKNLLQRADKESISKIKEVCQAFNTSTQGEINRVGAAYYAAIDKIFDNVILIRTLKDELKILARDTLREKQKDLDEALEALLARANGQMIQYGVDAMQMEKTAKRWIIFISMTVIVFGLLYGWFVSSQISRVLSRIIEGLNAGSDQVASASLQLSASSQSLAEGASEQAASVEETSSSLEEMASMTRQNADHAAQANDLMSESSRTVGKANDAMKELTGSMEEISKASEETSKIIKTIDEIAFQTNLLALNAAVEAARAGEAGAGFAVVAEEVRNLALRAAQAAKNTAALIEGTEKKVKNGSHILAQSRETFADVSKSASKVGDLVAEINAASREQAQGIEQINLAVAEMDKVIQQNASNAEESASASEELSGQAEEMKAMVERLMTIVGGNGKKQGNAFYKVKTGETPSVAGAAEKTRFGAKPMKAFPKNEIRPDQMIAFED